MVRLIQIFPNVMVCTLVRRKLKISLINTHEKYCELFLLEIHLGEGKDHKKGYAEEGQIKELIVTNFQVLACKEEECLFSEWWFGSLTHYVTNPPFC